MFKLRRFRSPFGSLAGSLTALCALAFGNAAEAADAGLLQARGCAEPAAIMAVAPAKSSAYLPAGYVPKSILGNPKGASLLMGITRCSAGTLNGQVLDGGFILGERVLMVQPRDSSEGLQFYAIEQVTNRPEIASWLAAAGYPVVLDPSVVSVAGDRTAMAVGDGVSIEIGRLLPFVSPLSISTIWHEAPGGTSRFQITVLAPKAQSSVAIVNADPATTNGAVIADLLGKTKARGIGALNRFDYDATLQTLVTPAAQ